MSRVPQSPSSKRSYGEARSRAVSPSKPSSATPSRTRTKSMESRPTSRNSYRGKAPVEEAPPVPKVNINIREAIAAKRAEAAKLAAQAKAAGGNMDMQDLSGALPDAPISIEESADEVGRLSIRETIERARNTGSINLSARSLPCLPSALFDIHLGITPDPLKSVPHEPILEPSVSQSRKGTRAGSTNWYDSQDLQVLKAWTNDIIEIQHEISLFGSLKVVDLHNNKIATLPSSFADLVFLETLDLSHNQLVSIPDKIFAFPVLLNLNLSHNQLTSLRFMSPFKAGSQNTKNSQLYGSSNFFGPQVSHATKPLPKIYSIDASWNQIPSSGIDHDGEQLPQTLVKFDLSGNPIASGISLLRSLSSLSRLRELRFDKADLSDEAFPNDLLTSSAVTKSPFLSLRLLDCSETKVTGPALSKALAPLKQELSYDLVLGDPPEGTLRLLVGKQVIKEAWEIEGDRLAAEKLARSKLVILTPETPQQSTPQNRASLSSSLEKPLLAEEVVSEWWSEPSKVSGSNPPTQPSHKVSGSNPITSAKEPSQKSVVKEGWELEAEAGLLTEGGRRRARAAAALAAAAEQAALREASKPAFSLENSPYYNERMQSLTLPSSTPITKGHNRAFSYAPSLGFAAGASAMDVALPTPTLPYSYIGAQSFAQNLRVLILKNRRQDISFMLPTAGKLTSLLPNVSELSLEGCGLKDMISISTDGEALTPPVQKPLIEIIATLFPRLQILDLSENAISSACLLVETLSHLILAKSDSRPGLRTLRLRGNRLADLDAFITISERFKGNRDLPDWKMEELDVRDNEISRLPGELGLLPLDVFLVDGNSFRVPARRVWEREGTKGLLTWLRSRLE